MGSLALVFTLLRRLPRWWWPIQLLFAPAIWALLQVEIPPLASTVVELDIGAATLSGGLEQTTSRGVASAVLPARAMEDIFSDVARQSKTTARWISVNTKAMSLDHEPSSEFEKHAAEEIKGGLIAGQVAREALRIAGGPRDLFFFGDSRPLFTGQVAQRPPVGRREPAAVLIADFGGRVA